MVISSIDARELWMTGSVQVVKRFKREVGDKIWQEKLPNGSMGWYSDLSHRHGKTTLHTCSFGFIGDCVKVKEPWAICGAYDDKTPKQMWDWYQRDLELIEKERKENGNIMGKFTGLPRVFYISTIEQDEIYKMCPGFVGAERSAGSMPDWAVRTHAVISDIHLVRDGSIHDWHIDLKKTDSRKDALARKVEISVQEYLDEFRQTESA